MKKAVSSLGKFVAEKPRAVIAGTAAAATASLAARDLRQKNNSIFRNYPVLGHARYLAHRIRPEIHQYFVENNWDGRPFNYQTREMINQRANGTEGEMAFGTERDVMSSGFEYLVHSVMPAQMPDEAPRAHIGGKDCTKPYDMSLMNISAMSFGALSANAVRALNKGAELGGFAHDTGEGGVSPYHREMGGDIIWEVGSGYFGCRNRDGTFNPELFASVAGDDQIKMVELKISQGAKPGHGGVLPAAKVSEEISKIRGVPMGEDCISPAYHKAFSTPIQMMEFVANMRKLSGGKPAGFKMCIGHPWEFLAICKAMKESGLYPDFIVVDGNEGGTGAAPLEFMDHLGMPMREGVNFVHNALIGIGARDRIKIGASGKVAAANDIVKRLIQGADYTNSGRSMMMAVGCIQAQKCQTGQCPSGVATQSKWRQRALEVDSKAVRVKNYHNATVDQAVSMMASCGATTPAELTPNMLRQVIAPGVTRSYKALYNWLEPGQLLDDAPEAWTEAWKQASPDEFRLPVITKVR